MASLDTHRDAIQEQRLKSQQQSLSTEWDAATARREAEATRCVDACVDWYFGWTASTSVRGCVCNFGSGRQNML